MGREKVQPGPFWTIRGPHCLRKRFQSNINTPYPHPPIMDDIPRARIKDANTWWQHLPDCVKVALFEDYWDLNEHDGEGQTEELL